MAQINEDILSELKALDTSEKIKDFLFWLVNFERENIDRENFQYKPQLQEKIDQLTSE